MPTGYVKKLSKKHGVSTSTGEKHWALAKAAAKKEGHGEDYGYVTSIFKKMMHEQIRIPTLKDLIDGMSFKHYLVAEADMETPQMRERSEAYKHLERFPQFGELPFKARRELEKEAAELVDGYEEMPQEEKDSIDDYLHDQVIDKMQEIVGKGVNFRDWNKEDEEYRARKAAHDAEQADVDAASGSGEEPNGFTAKLKAKRASAGPRHIAAMRQQHIPTDRAAEAPAGSNEVGAPVKSYYKPWGALSPEQRASRAGLAKKHGTIYRVKNSNWFRAMSPEQQQAVLSGLKGGKSVADSRQAAMGQ
jgi:hypothetical protein